MTNSVEFSRRRFLSALSGGCAALVPEHSRAAFNLVTRNKLPIRSGLSTIDNVIGGFSPGALVVVGTRSGNVGYPFLLQLANSISESHPTALIVEPYYQDGETETGIDGYLREYPAIALSEFGYARWASYDNNQPNPKPLLNFSPWNRSASRMFLPPVVEGNWLAVIADSVELEDRAEFGLSITRHLVQLKRWAVATGGVVIVRSCLQQGIDNRDNHRPQWGDLPEAAQSLVDVVLLLHQDCDHCQETPDQSLVELSVLVATKPFVDRALLNFSPSDWPSFTTIS